MAAIMPGVGFGPPSGNPNDPGDTADTVNILPFTVDLGTWNAFMQAYTSGSFAAAPATSFGQAYASLAAPGNGNGNGNGNDAEPVFVDQYHYNHSTGQVEPGGDGIPELNIYPDLNSSLPSGNRGTVDLGAPNNSTNDLKRQI